MVDNEIITREGPKRLSDQPIEVVKTKAEQPVEAAAPTASETVPPEVPAPAIREDHQMRLLKSDSTWTLMKTEDGGDAAVSATRTLRSATKVSINTHAVESSQGTVKGKSRKKKIRKRD